MKRSRVKKFSSVHYSSDNPNGAFVLAFFEVAALYEPVFKSPGRGRCYLRSHSTETLILRKTLSVSRSVLRYGDRSTET